LGIKGVSIGLQIEKQQMEAARLFLGDGATKTGGGQGDQGNSLTGAIL